MSEDWLDRWANGRTGWHESAGNAGLKAHWRGVAGSVLVPLCGKSPDLVWLAGMGHDVVGVELANVAIREFFSEQGLGYEFDDRKPLGRFTCTDAPITIFCGDYFELNVGPFDALYDRGALVAVDPARRADYVEHTKALLRADADRLIVTLEYDQRIVQGPPFSVMADEILRYWGDLSRVSEVDDIDNCPPKFGQAGLTEIKEVVWQSGC